MTHSVRVSVCASVLIACLLIPSSADSAARAIENVRWVSVREYMAQLTMASSAWGVPLGINVSNTWEQLSAEQRRLFALARQYDDAEERLSARDRGLMADAAQLESDARALNRELSALADERNRLEPVRVAIDQESAQIAAEYQAILNARARNENPPVDGYNARHDSVQNRRNSFSSVAGAFNQRLAAWQAASAAWSARRDVFERARLDLVGDYTRFNADADANYGAPVRIWERQIAQFIARQQDDRERIRTEIASKSSRPAPALEPPRPKIDVAAVPRMMVDALTAPQRLLRNGALYSRNAAVYATQHPDEVGEAALMLAPVGVAAAGMEIAFPAAVVIWGGSAFYEAGLKGGLEREAERQKEELDRQRRMPKVIRGLDAYNRSLEDQVRAGTLSASDKRIQLGERARLLVGTPSAAQEADRRLIEDMFLSSNWSWGIVTSAAGWAAGAAAEGAATPSIKEAAPFANASHGTVGATTEMFKSGVEQSVQGTVKSVRDTTTPDSRLKGLAKP